MKSVKDSLLLLKAMEAEEGNDCGDVVQCCFRDFQRERAWYL